MSSGLWGVKILPVSSGGLFPGCNPMKGVSILYYFNILGVNGELVGCFCHYLWAF